MHLVTLEGDELLDSLDPSFLHGDSLPAGTEILELHGEFEVNGEDENFLYGDFTADEFSYLTPQHKQELAGEAGLAGDEIEELNGLAFLKALGKFKMPKMPKLKMPKIKIPKLKIPKLKMPKLKAPKFKMKFKAPKFKMKMPNLKMPNLDSLNEGQDEEAPEEPEELDEQQDETEETGEESEEALDETEEDFSEIPEGEDFSEIPEGEELNDENEFMNNENEESLSGEGSIIGDTGELVSAGLGLDPLASIGVNIGSRVLDRVAGMNKSTRFLSSDYGKEQPKPKKKIKVKIKPKPAPKKKASKKIIMKAAPSGKFALTREANIDTGEKSDGKNKMILFGE